MVDRIHMKPHLIVIGHSIQYVIRHSDGLSKWARRSCHVDQSFARLRLKVKMERVSS